MNYKEKTLKLWRYLAKTGLGKMRAYNNLRLRVDYNFCPLCQYAFDKTDLDEEYTQLNCKHCPMYKKWDVEDGTKSRTCNATNTYYFHWKNANTSAKNDKETRKKYAKLLYENFKKGFEMK